MTEQSKFMYRRHGWSQKDVKHLEDNAFEMIEDPEGRWAIGLIQDESGMVWLLPIGRTNKFSLSLWKELRTQIEKYPISTVPMSKNQELLEKGASKYGGYLLDNNYVFNNRMKEK